MRAYRELRATEDRLEQTDFIIIGDGAVDDVNGCLENDNLNIYLGIA